MKTLCTTYMNKTDYSSGNERTIVWTYAFLNAWKSEHFEHMNFGLERTKLWSYVIVNARKSGHRDFWTPEELTNTFEHTKFWT